MNLIRDFMDSMDAKWLETHITNLYKIERKQTFPAYQAAARYTYDLLCSEGFEAELISFPADGKTVYQDKCCPIGWDVSDMWLEVVSGVPGFDGKRISDYEIEPLSCAKHSTATPPEGVLARLMTETQMRNGEDITGAFVLLDFATRPLGPALRMLLDGGAVGWVSDYQEEGVNDDVDAVYWCNAATEYGTWATTLEDRAYTSYQISPRMGDTLRAACAQGEVMLRAYSDGKRYETEQYGISALLPGEDKREVWILSHLYEPLFDDNSNGVIGSIALLKALRKFSQEGKIKLKYSVRFVAASEMYGMAAMAEYFGGDLSARCIGAINTDGTITTTDKSVYSRIVPTEAPDLPGFVGNIFMQLTCDHIRSVCPNMQLSYHDHRYADDCFMSDVTVGLPTVWFRHYGGYHHHSSSTEAMMDMPACIEHLAFHGDWICAMAASTAEEVKTFLPRAVELANEAMLAAAKQDVREGTDVEARLHFVRRREQEKIRGFYLYADIPEIEEACNQVLLPKAKNKQLPQKDAWFQKAENFVFTRTHRGFPHDLKQLPKEERIYLPGDVTYSDFADVLSRMDGKKTFRQILTEIEWDMGFVYAEETIEAYLDACMLLARGGYLAVEEKKI